MLCWKCNEQETRVGQSYCDQCLGPWRIRMQELATKEMQRRGPDPFTYLYFCTTCGVEVYRYQHVRRRTERLLQHLSEQSRLELVKHVHRARHDGGLQEVCINERFGDDGFEVPATEVKAPSHLQASSVLRVLGAFPKGADR